MGAANPSLPQLYNGGTRKILFQIQTSEVPVLLSLLHKMESAPLKLTAKAASQRKKKRRIGEVFFPDCAVAGDSFPFASMTQ